MMNGGVTRILNVVDKQRLVILKRKTYINSINYILSQKDPHNDESW